MASGGIGTPALCPGELFKMMTGIDIGHVPYRGGGPALTDLFAGQVQVYFSHQACAIEYIRAGSAACAGRQHTERSEVLPDLATVAEFVPDIYPIRFLRYELAELAAEPCQHRSTEV